MPLNDRNQIRTERSPAALLFGMIGIPIAGILVLLVYCTPRYMPSDALQRMPSITPQQVATTLRKCRSGVYVSADQVRAKPLSVVSWENDKGLVARTVVRCEGEVCAVEATAMFNRSRLGNVFSCQGKRDFLIYPAW